MHASTVANNILFSVNWNTVEPLLENKYPHYHRRWKIAIHSGGPVFNNLWRIDFFSGKQCQDAEQRVWWTCPRGVDCFHPLMNHCSGQQCPTWGWISVLDMHISPWIHLRLRLWFVSTLFRCTAENSPGATPPSASAPVPGAFCTTTNTVILFPNLLVIYMQITRISEDLSRPHSWITSERKLKTEEFWRISPLAGLEHDQITSESPIPNPSIRVIPSSLAQHHLHTYHFLRNLSINMKCLRLEAQCISYMDCGIRYFTYRTRL